MTTLNLTSIPWAVSETAPDFKHLTKMILSRCSLKSFPVLPMLPNLLHIDLSFNSIQDIDDEVKYTPNLTHLDLSANYIRKVNALSGISTHLQKLTHLEMRFNDVCKRKRYRLAAITSFTTLQYLDGKLIQKDDKVHLLR